MPLQPCPICSAQIDGDETYYAHHVNRCLDSTASSSPSAAQLDDDDNASRALALELQGDELVVGNGGVGAGEVRREDAGEEDDEGCPVCGRSFGALGLGVREWGQHASACLSQVAGSDGDEDEDAVDGGSSIQYRRAADGKDAGDDQVQGVAGLIPVLSALLVRSHSDGKTQSAYLCNDATEHIETRLRDFGWGCGYRNAQMLFTSLRRMDCYLGIDGDDAGGPPVPSIREFQELIEAAWKEGYDPPGAQHFKHKLCGSRKWIGTTEIYTAFTYLGIRATVVDFPKGVGNTETHSALVQWIVNYFRTPLTIATSSSLGKRPPATSPGKDTFQVLMESNGTPVQMTGKQPLYLQHDGHSRTVVGVDVGKGGEWLLIFDPGKKCPSALRSASSSLLLPAPVPKRHKADSSPLPVASAKTDAFWRTAPGHSQIWKGRADIGSAKKAAGGGSRMGGLDVGLHRKHLESYRVGVKNLSRRDEYQILYVEEGKPLTQGEKMARQIVSAVKITA